MVTVTLTEEQAGLVKKSLEYLLSDLRMELADTDRQDFRDMLREEKSAIEALIVQLDHLE